MDAARRHAGRHPQRPAALLCLLLVALQQGAALAAFSQSGGAPAPATRRIRAPDASHAEQQPGGSTPFSAAAAADALTAGSSSAGADKWDASDEPSAHTPFNSEASIQIAVRQRLFDYAVQTGLAVLDASLKDIVVPEYRSTLNFPVIGGVDVGIAGVNITSLEVPHAQTKVRVMWMQQHQGREACSVKLMGTSPLHVLDWGRRLLPCCRLAADMQKCMPALVCLAACTCTCMRPPRAAWIAPACAIQSYPASLPPWPVYALSPGPLCCLGPVPRGPCLRR